MSEKDSVVESGVVPIGVNGTSDLLDPTTLEDKKPQSLPHEEITEKALKEITKFFLEGVYSIRGSLEGHEFSIKALLTGQRVSDEIFNLNQNLRFSTVSIGKLLGDSSQYLSHFIENGGITLYNFDNMPRIFRPIDYMCVNLSINAIDTVDITEISKKTVGIYISPDPKIIKKVLNIIYSRDEQDAKDIQEIYDSCESTSFPTLDSSKLGTYFPELKPILDTNQIMCLAVQNAYLPVTQIPLQHLPFFATATYKKIGEQQYNGEDKAPLPECTKEISDLLSSIDIRRCRRETKNTTRNEELISIYNNAMDDRHFAI